LRHCSYIAARKTHDEKALRRRPRKVIDVSPAEVPDKFIIVWINSRRPWRL
jgi:hypothetical protein